MDDTWFAKDSQVGAVALNARGIKRRDLICGDDSTAVGFSVTLCFGDRGHQIVTEPGRECAPGSNEHSLPDAGHSYSPGQIHLTFWDFISSSLKQERKTQAYCSVIKFVASRGRQM